MRNREVSFNVIKLFNCINYLICYIALSYHTADNITVTLVSTDIYIQVFKNNFEH